MNRLKELVKEIKEQKAILAVNPGDIDPQVRATFEGSQRNAGDVLKKLEDQYRNEITNHVVAVSIVGEFAADFAVKAAALGVVAINYQQVVDDIESNLKDRNAGVEYDSNTHFMLLDELSKIRIKHEMVRLPNPTVNGYNDGVYGSSIKDALKIIFNKNYGEGLQSAISRREIGRIALSGNFAGSKLPVFLYNNIGNVDTTFLPAPVTIIKIDKEMDKDEVLGKIKELKGILNGKAPQNEGQDKAKQSEGNNEQ